MQEPRGCLYGEGCLTENLVFIWGSSQLTKGWLGNEEPSSYLPLTSSCHCQDLVLTSLTHFTLILPDPFSCLAYVLCYMPMRSKLDFQGDTNSYVDAWYTTQRPHTLKAMPMKIFVKVLCQGPLPDPTSWTSSPPDDLTWHSLQDAQKQSTSRSRKLLQIFYRTRWWRWAEPKGKPSCKRSSVCRL